MPLFGRLQLYVLSRTLAAIGVAFVVIASVVMLVCFVELSRRFGGNADVGLIRMMELMGLQAPAIVLLLLPFIFLFGTMSAFVALNRSSELIAMRAAGVSAWRFIFPAAAVALAIGVLDVLVLNPIAADLSGRYEELQEAIQSGSRAEESSPVWLRQGDAHTQVVIHADTHEMVGGQLVLKGVSLFLQNVTAGGALQFTRRIEAVDARLTPGFWRLSDVREAMPGAGSVHSETLSIPSTLDRRTAMEKFASKESVGFWRLPETIRHADAAGFSSAAYRLRLQELLATPVLFAGMAVLAAAFSLPLMRLGGVAGLAGAGVALGFIIFFFGELCSALGGAEVIPAPLAGWAPALIALLAGVTLLSYTEDG